jgi:hypothetical protein
MGNDEILIDAYQRLVAERQCSADQILWDPDVRHRFLELTGNMNERDALHRLLYLRKRKRLPRSR